MATNIACSFRIWAEGGEPTKIQVPALPDTVMLDLTLQQGSTTSFDFRGSTVNKIGPNQAHAYEVNYEADISNPISAQKSRSKLI